MEDELRRRIAEDLRKAGFESEMLAIEEFARRGWQCEGSAGYRDRDQDISRELDLLARFGLHRMRPTGGSIQCVVRIVGEVKKAERPWVVLRERPLASEELIDAWNNLTYGVNLPADQVSLATNSPCTRCFSEMAGRRGGFMRASNLPALLPALTPLVWQCARQPNPRWKRKKHPPPPFE